MDNPSWAALRRLVHERASFRCEYCQTAMDNIGQAMHIDHIDPLNGDNPDNLCLSCSNCNLSKAAVVQSADPQTDDQVALFNPRLQAWRDHFSWADNGLRLVGLTPTGRATVERLKMNRSRVVRARRRWVESGFHPPTDT